MTRQQHRHLTLALLILLGAALIGTVNLPYYVGQIPVRYVGPMFGGIFGVNVWAGGPFDEQLDENAGPMPSESEYRENPRHLSAADPGRARYRCLRRRLRVNWRSAMQDFHASAVRIRALSCQEDSVRTRDGVPSGIESTTGFVLFAVAMLATPLILFAIGCALNRVSLIDGSGALFGIDAVLCFWGYDQRRRTPAPAMDTSAPSIEVVHERPKKLPLPRREGQWDTVLDR